MTDFLSFRRFELKTGILFILIAMALPLWSQEATKVDPVFGQENKNLVFVEGENAVSTNFATQPILNYSCSGSQTLQLSRTTALQSGAPFYAEFAFYIETPGTYELWYGGTPSGPKDDLSPS